MVDDIIDQIVSLSGLMADETAALRRHGPFPAQQEIAAAKMLLASGLDAALSRMGGTASAWIQGLDEADGARLTAALEALSVAGNENAAMLRRHIELSNELMAAITNEVRRVSGSRSATYTAAGRLSQTDIPTPISINSGI
ncbi:flagellar biosynthesis protein FlgN [Iodidimonas sp. SYSU 1G8]|uniref:flagellar biosynthesis protein FlgN n=1 Tax=Iodidimonas sp. SYSU 1G8 TaxID=3133967 RepID=UPI0031FEA5B4